MILIGNGQSFDYAQEQLANKMLFCLLPVANCLLIIQARNPA